MKNVKKCLAGAMALMAISSLSSIVTSADSITRIENGKEVVYYDTYEEYMEVLGESNDYEGSYLDWFVMHNTNNMGETRDVSEEVVEVTTAAVDEVVVIDNSETTLQHGDVNGDGTINALDLLQLKKYILGIVDSL